jgi:hypothetical protein
MALGTYEGGQSLSTTKCGLVSEIRTKYREGLLGLGRGRAGERENTTENAHDDLQEMGVQSS